MSRRPNVLFITCDQWRGDCLSAAGHPVVRTPNADALAREGTLFARHYAGAAPCSPARACIYTGRYQMTNRVCRNGSPLDARFGNVALAARALGYDPTLFGYTDVSPDPRAHAPGDPVLTSYEGVLPGFTVRQLLPEHQKPWLSWLRAQGVHAPPFPDVHRPVRSAGEVSSAPPIYTRRQTPAAFLVAEFTRWLGEQDAARPWFAHLSFISPHPPYIAPEPFNTMYDPDDGPDFRRAGRWQDECATHPWLADHLERQKRSKFIPGAKGRLRGWTEKEFRTIRAIYYGMISEIDDKLGQLWSTLRRSGAWEDTVVVLTSDHGEMMGDHFMLGKGGYFDGSYHVPLVIRVPGATGSRRVDAFTEAVDIKPTLIDLMGGTPPAWLDGRSLAPLLGRSVEGWRDCAHWEFDFRALGKPEGRLGLSPRDSSLAVIRSDTFKYVHFGGGLPPLLFDMAQDPGELRNLAGDPTYRLERLALAEKMLAWRSAHLDQTLAFIELTETGPRGPAWPAA
ncbi:MAG: alkaline phosphatase family protein [Rhizobiaceae bacterium]|nr:alkaline phosphatase family protein [Rhizobiaceae bacterium]